MQGHLVRGATGLGGVGRYRAVFRKEIHDGISPTADAFQVDVRKLNIIRAVALFAQRLFSIQNEHLAAYDFVSPIQPGEVVSVRSDWVSNSCVVIQLCRLLER